MNRNGFTLIELLIAAAIIGVLAVLSTTTYKNTMVKGRLEEGETRTRAVATAVKRFMIDYPSHTFSGDNLVIMSSVGDCATGNDSPAQLIQCGYLENRPWSDGYFDIEVCGTKTTGLCGTNTSDPKRLVCMSGNKDGKLKDCSGTTKYLFCVKKDGTEYLLNSCM